jgi:hypothetical protein
MVKQVNSDAANSSTESVHQTKFNKITVFLTKFIFGDNFEFFKKIGYVDSYVSDPEISNTITLGENQRLLFILFKNKKLGAQDIKKVIQELMEIPVQVVFSYELVNDYFMVVIDFPEQFTIDFDFIVKGQYSKLSKEFMKRFPSAIDVVNEQGQRVGKEYTLYYHIFNKTQWLKDFWIRKLDLFELDDRLELWGKPDNRDLVFDKNILKIK